MVIVNNIDSEEVVMVGVMEVAPMSIVEREEEHE